MNTADTTHLLTPSVTVTPEAEANTVDLEDTRGSVSTTLNLDASGDAVVTTSRPTYVSSFPAITARALASMTFEDVDYVIPGLLPVGLVVLAGSPKIGKSFLAMDLAYSVAAGETFLDYDTEAGSVLFVALEDPQRRIYERLAARRGSGATDVPVTFLFPSQIHIDQLMDEVRAWRAATPNAKVVIVDTYGRVEIPRQGAESDYDHVTRVLGPVQQLAHELELSIVLIHHNRKSQVDGGDRYDKVHGSVAMTAIPDATVMIDRERNQRDTLLSITGRDVPEREFAYRLDVETSRAVAYRQSLLSTLTQPQLEIVNLVRDGINTPKDIATTTGKSGPNIQNYLKRLLKYGVIRKGKTYGTYELTDAASKDYGLGTAGGTV